MTYHVPKMKWFIKAASTRPATQALIRTLKTHSTQHGAGEDHLGDQSVDGKLLFNEP
jgi:hypothetical protein